MTYANVLINVGIRFAKGTYEKSSQPKKKKSHSFIVTRYFTYKEMSIKRYRKMFYNFFIKNTFKKMLCV
jgi:hypothetical protein